MSDPKIPIECTAMSVTDKRDVKLTMPWFACTSKYLPRPANVVQPLINGQRAFGAVHDAIMGAKKSIDIISWGFDPSMRLKPPTGERIGELLRKKAEAGVQVRILVWKSALANLMENNIIGDGLMGSGGGSAGAGSGVGSTSAGNASGGKNGFNGYGSTHSGPDSGAVAQGDPDAKSFNRDWFKTEVKNLSFRTRDFGPIDRAAIGLRDAQKRGYTPTGQRTVFVSAPSHHQKMILVDYETSDQAVGFVMGHNLLRNYWDTDSHEYHSAARLGFPPWQDLSSRVYGPVLWDMNENFCTAWTKAQPWIGNDQPIPPGRLKIEASVFEAPAAKQGECTPAQICRTQPQENDRSILEVYQHALCNARNYVYFENQYFRSLEIAMLMREVRRKLKTKGWKRDFYIFVVTNVPDDMGRLTTYETLHALGKADCMPALEKKKTGDEADGDSAALRKADLEGVNIHVCTLCTSGQQYHAPQAYFNSGTGPMGFPAASVSPASYTTVYADIYVHSKLLLVDDVFFTLGSANVNTRSLEVDSELNIAVPSPNVTRQWRNELWAMHTKKSVSDDPAMDFREWRKLMTDNSQAKRDGQQLAASLVEFYDDGSAHLRAD